MPRLCRHIVVVVVSVVRERKSDRDNVVEERGIEVAVVGHVKVVAVAVDVIVGVVQSVIEMMMMMMIDPTAVNVIVIEKVTGVEEIEDVAVGDRAVAVAIVIAIVMTIHNERIAAAAAEEEEEEEKEEGAAETKSIDDSVAIAVAVDRGVEVVIEEEVDVVEVVGHLRREGAIREIGTRVMVVVAVPVTEEISIIVMDMDEVVADELRTVVADVGVEATVLQRMPQ